MKKCGQIAKGTKTAIVTGASTGIGRCYAERLAMLGYNLIIISRTNELLEELAEQLEAKNGVKVRALAKDLATVTAAKELFDWTKSEGYVIDVLINNAGMFSFCDVINTPDERFVETITLHDITNTLLCKYFAADMASRGGGYILNMSSYSIWMP